MIKAGNDGKKKHLPFCILFVMWAEMLEAKED
jgi:hypothetical protein